MRRREFLLGSLSSVAVPSFAFAQSERCGPVQPIPFGLMQGCEVGIPITSTPLQNCQQWCWAACCEAIFSLAGFSVSQETFVDKLFGSSNVCAPANGTMIKKAIDGPWIDQDGNSFYARCDIVMDASTGISNPNPLAVIWDELNAGRALISGSLSHAVLITAMQYTKINQGVRTDAVVVRDPWPGNHNPITGNRRVYSIQEFYSVDFLATLRIY